jgi:hypothetical protein
MGDSAEDYDIEFNFENESLKHKVESTMREDMFQVSYQPTQLLSIHPHLFHLCCIELDRSCP